MSAAQILALLLQYGPGFVDLVFRLKTIADTDKTEISASDWEQLKAKYSTKTADQYLAEAKLTT